MDEWFVVKIKSTFYISGCSALKQVQFLAFQDFLNTACEWTAAQSIYAEITWK